MNIDEVSRPRQKIASSVETEPRAKCCLCCGMRQAAYVFVGVVATQLPAAIGLFGSKTVLASKWALMDYALFLPLPFTLITFTHQVLLSEALWSKNKKTVLECNMESSALNVGLWAVIIGTATLISRGPLQTRSKAYRLMMWEYQRKNRAAQNQFMPSMYGTLSIDLDWYTWAWCVSLYHCFWGAVTMMLEKQQGSHYAMFYRSSSYSKRCSPRWREWRELKVREEVDNKHMVLKGRWGNVLNSDTWRSRGVD